MYLKLLFLVVIDYILIWFWVKYINPDPSLAIGLIIYVPFVTGINCLIALIFFIYKRNYTKLFLLNAVISAVLMVYLYNEEMNSFQNKRFEYFSFKVGSKLFDISLSKLDSTFWINYNLGQDSYSKFASGKYVEMNNEILLMSDSLTYKIKDQYLFGFKNKVDSIKLANIE